MSGYSAAVKRKEAKREAARIASNLVETAAGTATSDPDLARRQAALARRIALKFNVRFDWRLKRFYCHGCKGLLYPGVNARCPIGPGPHAHHHLRRLQSREQEKTWGTLKYTAEGPEQLTP